MDKILRRGDNGESVRQLQERLKGQQIDADGVVGSKTWNRFDDSNGYKLLATRYR